MMTETILKPATILSLADPRATLETVGGKGASLARLTVAGLPVPGGFHVTTAAYRQFVAENTLQPAILEALEKADASQPASLETASGLIHKLFAQGRMPQAIAEEIARAYEDLPGDHPVVAVRSSATAEDLPDLSFAGQQETFLNIHGLPAVLEAVKLCWASLWTARAIGYRLQHQIDQEAVSLAVVVQLLVHAEASGILFTANPIDGQRDQAMITASWGLGEAIVGGLVTPDTLIVEKSSGQVLKRDTADKQVMTVLLESSTDEHPVPETMRRIAVLADRQAVELTQLGVQIEKLYGMPMDIEWTLAEGRFAIVQARPITALPEPEVSPPTEWKRSDPRAIYFRSSIVEQLPDPLTPLFATLGVKIISLGSARLFNDLLGKGTAADDMFTTVNGYAYYRMRLGLNIVAGAIRAVVKFWPEFKRSEQRWREGAHARYVAVIERWCSRPASALTAVELLEAMLALMAETVNTYNVIQSGVLGLAGGAEVLFAQVYDKLVKRPGDPPAATLLLGYDSLPILAEKSLYDLAQQARLHPALAEYLARTPAAQLADQLAGDQAPSGFEAEAWRTWQQSFSTHLERYGHAIYDLDFAKPVPADNPAPMLETCKMYLGGQGTSPYDRQKMLTGRREQAIQSMLGRLKGLRLKLFRKTLGWAQSFGPMREDSLADLGLGYPLLRRFLHELGRRLVRSGALAQPDEVYWLYEEEVDRLAVALDQRESLTSMAEAIRPRQALWRAQKTLTPPTALPERSRMSRAMEKLGPANTSQAASRVLKGAGASHGQVTGRALVLHGPQDFDQMQPGEILVAAITTPAWTPLFAMASAIVTDVGGALSHGSIVAREYGIPAVLGTGLATKRIRSGQTITVDGTAGQVILDGSPTPPIPAGFADWLASMPNPKGQYMRGSVVDILPDPLSPLFATLGIPAVARVGIKQVMRPLTRSEPELPADYITTIHGYAYLSASYTPRQWWWILTRMLPSFPRILRECTSLWRDKIRPSYAAAAARWQNKPLEAIPAAELWAGVQEVNDAAMLHLATLLVATTGASAGSEMLLTRVYEKMARRSGDPAAPVFLMGYNSIPIQAEKSLYDLAQWCRQQPGLVETILNTPTAEIVAQLSTSAGAGEEFNSRLRDHLQTYGHLIYDLDFAKALPLDDPAPMLETIKMYLRGAGVNPHERQKEVEARRIRAVATTGGRLKGLKSWAFRKSLGWAQSMAEVRENALSDIGLGYPALRRMLHELGRRLAAAGAFSQPDDIYWLEQAELERAVVALEHGNPVENMAERIEPRKMYCQELKRLTPPPTLPPRKKFMGIDMAAFTPAAAESQAGGTLKGVAASAGKVTAPARVIRNSEDFGQMRPGDVLVATTTTPAWTPLFAMASAIVTDIGGPLSHGSIVAREYGIPAVMGTGVATRRIHSGQTITVDGDGGYVHIND